MASVSDWARSSTDERTARGLPFRSLYDFCECIDHAKVSRRVIEALIVAGALDSLPGGREQKLAGLDLALARAHQKRKDRELGQGGLFEAVERDEDDDGVLPEVPSWSSMERLGKEREATGLYLSGHPLDDDRARTASVTCDTTFHMSS